MVVGEVSREDLERVRSDIRRVFRRADVGAPLNPFYEFAVIYCVPLPYAISAL